MTDSLLYVSRAALKAGAGGSEIEEILATARSRNQSLDVTGALIHTNEGFAQLLEGPSTAIKKLMESIKRDARHTDVRILREETDVDRRFEGWHMAYDGSSIFVARHVRVLSASFAAPDEAQVTRLLDLMMSLAGGESSDQPT